jgi:hypothetical protein
LTRADTRVLTQLYWDRIRPVLGDIDTAHPIASEDIAEVERRLVDRALRDGRNPHSPEVAAWRAYTQHHARSLSRMLAGYVEARRVSATA